LCDLVCCGVGKLGVIFLIFFFPPSWPGSGLPTFFLLFLFNSGLIPELGRWEDGDRCGIEISRVEQLRGCSVGRCLDQEDARA
jgi:hypothetical protein